MKIFNFSAYEQLLKFALLKTTDHQEIFFNYSYIIFAFNFQFEKSLIEYIFVFFKFFKKILLLFFIRGSILYSSTVRRLITTECSWADSQMSSSVLCVSCLRKKTSKQSCLAVRSTSFRTFPFLTTSHSSGISAIMCTCGSTRGFSCHCSFWYWTSRCYKDIIT